MRCYISTCNKDNNNKVTQTKKKGDDIAEKILNKKYF